MLSSTAGLHGRHMAARSALPGTAPWAILAVMVLPLLLVSTLQSAGAQWCAVAADGRIAFEREGHIHIMREGTPPSRITGGIAIDRQPAWSVDGRWLVFVSDRGGGLHLWRIAINDLSATGAPEQLTRSPEADSEPAVSTDGSIVFVRGSGSAADLWIRANDGSEKKLTSAAGAERSPSVSREGIVAYVAIRDGRRQLRAIRLDGSQDRAVLA